MSDHVERIFTSIREEIIMEDHRYYHIKLKAESSAKASYKDRNQTPSIYFRNHVSAKGRQ